MKYQRSFGLSFVFDAVGAVLLLCLTGCHGSAGTGGSMAVTRTDGQVLTQVFNSGYISDVNEGECDVVLLNDALADVPAPKGDRPLEPVAVAPVQHFMHIHVYWRPESKMGSNHPAAINASIEWYVVNGDSLGKSPYVRYEGAGFVLISGDEVKKVDVTGTLKPAGRIGNMRDPIGEASVRGLVKVTANDARVREVMGDIAGAPRPATRP